MIAGYVHQISQITKITTKSLRWGSLIFLLGFIASNLDSVRSQLINSNVILNNSNTDDNFENSPFYQPLGDFSKHTVIKPQIHHGKHKTLIRSTRDAEAKDGYHISHIILSYYHKGENVTVDLHLNENLFPDGHFLRFQDSKNGGDVVQNLTKTDLDLCHYQGTIRGKPHSKVALSTCNGGINGVIFDDKDTNLIHSSPNGRISDDHYLFQHEHILQNATCGYDNESNEINHRNHGKMNDSETQKHKTDFHHFKSPEFGRILRHKRSTSENMLRGPYNADKHSSFVELVIVVDNKVFQSYGENVKRVHKHCQDIANIVNALFVPLNIFVVLVGVVVWNEADEIELSSDALKTLNNFLEYRRTKLSIHHPNDNAQLITDEYLKLEGYKMESYGVKGTICSSKQSGAILNNDIFKENVASLMAQEMGNNIGLEYDSAECTCPDKECIMTPLIDSFPPSHWSSCSIDQLNVAFSRGMNYCLRNKPTKLFNSQLCGNGFVEPGEQCDCGLPNYCENTCCDPTTCMLRTNASCATGSCCDLNTCRPKTAGTECRSTEGECDLPEFCTGESEYCPTDVFKRDTKVCDNGNAFCFQGTCKSHSNQCKLLWGSSGVSLEQCYEINLKGNHFGNCGYDWVNKKYIQCKIEDINCGMLHCHQINNRLEFGKGTELFQGNNWVNYNGSLIECRAVRFDTERHAMDPGLTPNGAKCAANKMCVNQKCVHVEELRANGQGVKCVDNCNGHGYCNSKGHCHCYVGYSGSSCNSTGPGKSEDSGTASNPSKLNNFTRFLYIFLLGIVPLISILFLFIYFRKNTTVFVDLETPDSFNTNTLT